MGAPERLKFERMHVEPGMAHYCMDGHIIIYSDEMPPATLEYVRATLYDDRERELQAASLDWHNAKKRVTALESACRNLIASGTREAGVAVTDVAGLRACRLGWLQAVSEARAALYILEEGE